jgi:acyl-CoA thioesterase FadM
VRHALLVIVTFDYQTQQPIRVPDELRRAIEKLEEKQVD